MSSNLLDCEITEYINVVVYEVDWNCEVFDSSSDGFGLKDIDARLTVLENGEGSDVGLLKTNKLADALGERYRAS